MQFQITEPLPPGLQVTLEEHMNNKIRNSLFIMSSQVQNYKIMCLPCTTTFIYTYALAVTFTY